MRSRLPVQDAWIRPVLQTEEVNQGLIPPPAGTCWDCAKPLIRTVSSARKRVFCGTLCSQNYRRRQNCEQVDSIRQYLDQEEWNTTHVLVAKDDGQIIEEYHPLGDFERELFRDYHTRLYYQYVRLKSNNNHIQKENK